VGRVVVIMLVGGEVTIAVSRMKPPIRRDN